MKPSTRIFRGTAGAVDTVNKCEHATYRKTKLQHWRGFLSKNKLEAAPVLEFASLFLGLRQYQPRTRFDRRDIGGIDAAGRIQIEAKITG